MYSQVIPFSANDDLLKKLEAESSAGEVGAEFHCVALCDFKVKTEVEDATGEVLSGRKLSSREEAWPRAGSSSKAIGDGLLICVAHDQTMQPLDKPVLVKWLVGWVE